MIMYDILILFIKKAIVKYNMDNDMKDVQKMLKALIKGQSELSKNQSELSDKIDNVNSELLDKIDNVHSEFLVEIGGVHREVSDLRTETMEGFKKVNDRMDTLGKSLAYLEDDAPTREDFDNLETKVSKIGQILALG